MSYTRKYFEFIEGERARCKIPDCSKVIMRKGGSTKGLITHLKAAHQIVNEEKEEAGPENKRQKTLYECVKFSSFDETVARLICENNFNFRQIATCEYLRNSLAKDFRIKVPVNPTSIANHFLKFFELVKSKEISRIEELKKQGNKFSLTLDEWTACSNRRYLNVNLHYIDNHESHINLGLLRIKGSCNARKMKQMVSIILIFKFD